MQLDIKNHKRQPKLDAAELAFLRQRRLQGFTPFQLQRGKFVTTTGTEVTLLMLMLHSHYMENPKKGWIDLREKGKK